MTDFEKYEKKKQAFIKSAVDRKQLSMTEFAIRRDAAMFAVAEGVDTEFAPTAIKREFMKGNHQFWMDYFREVYEGGSQEVDDGITNIKARAFEQKDRGASEAEDDIVGDITNE